MKKTLTLYFLFLFISITSTAQTSNDFEVHKFMVGGSHNFQIVGESSNDFADSLFAHFPKTKRKGYIWKFKNVTIPGIETPITFKVHQGLYGEYTSENDSENCRGGHYFTTFTSEKYKQRRLSNKKSTEQFALTIYLKNGRNFAVTDSKEADIIKAFLLDLYKS